MAKKKTQQAFCNSNTLVVKAAVALFLWKKTFQCIG